MAAMATPTTTKSKKNIGPVTASASTGFIHSLANNTKAITALPIIATSPPNRVSMEVANLHYRLRMYGLDRLGGMLSLAAEDTFHAFLVVDRVLPRTAEDGIAARHTRYEIIPTLPINRVIATISGHLVAAGTTEQDVIPGAYTLQAVIAAHSVAPRTAIENVAAGTTVHEVSCPLAIEHVIAASAKQEITTIRADLHRCDSRTAAHDERHSHHRQDQAHAPHGLHPTFPAISLTM